MAVTPRNIRKAREYAQQAPTEFLVCRSGRRHRFADPSTLGLPGSKVELEFLPATTETPGCWQMVLYCESCGAKGTRTIDRRTGILAKVTTVVPPKGYKFEGGDGYAMDSAGTGQCTLELIVRMQEMKRERETAARKQLGRRVKFEPGTKR